MTLSMQNMKMHGLVNITENIFFQKNMACCFNKSSLLRFI